MSNQNVSYTWNKNDNEVVVIWEEPSCEVCNCEVAFCKEPSHKTHHIQEGVMYAGNRGGVHTQRRINY